MSTRKSTCIRLFSIIFALSLNTFSQFSLESGRANEICFSFKTPDYELTETMINGKNHTAIGMGNAPLVIDQGEPELPYLTQSVQIPNDAQMAIKVVDIKYKEISVKTIIPSKGNLLRSQNADDVPYVYNSLYKKDIYYKDSIAYLSDPFILRDVRGVTVSIYPFQYNPAKGILKIVESAKVVVYQKGVSQKNVLKRSARSVTKLFDGIYRRMFINYQSSRYTEISDGEKMVVITHPDYKSIVEPFVEWKNQKGIKTSLYEYKYGSAGNSISSMKNFIQKMYDDSNITYFMLVGDYEKIPSPMKTYGSETVPSDPSLMKLDGTDNYADAFIGRLSVQSDSGATTVINKILSYEKDPDTSGTWYEKAVGIASSEGSPTDISWIRNMGNVLLGYNYTRVDSIYQGKSPSVTKFSNYINAGRGWVNFMGHGNASGFGFKSGFWYTNSHVKALTNGSKLPVIISVACNNGQFNNRTCFAEWWQRHPNGGAVGFLGSTPLQDWKPPQDGQKEMVRLLSIDQYITLGAIVYNGEAKMVEVKGSAAAKTFNTWTLFGDPSMMVFTDTPTDLSVTAPTRIIANQGEAEIEVDFGEVIDGRVALYNSNTGILSSQIVDSSNSVVLTIPIAEENEILLTVTARNKVPFTQSINVEHAVNNFNNFSKLSTTPEISITSSSLLKLAVPVEGFYEISIFSVNGKSIFLKNMKIENGIGTIDLKENGLVPSVYFVKVRSRLHDFDKKIIIK